MPDPNDPSGNPLTDIAQILASASQGRALGKVNAGDLLLRQGSLANQMYTSALNAKAMDAALPATRMSQVARGDYAANVQDVTASGPERVMNNVIHFSGGLRPSAFSQTTRDAGTKLAGIASSAMGNETMPTPPTLPQLPASSLTDSLLAGGAGAAGILGALDKPGSSGNILGLVKEAWDKLHNGDPTTGDPYGPSPWGKGTNPFGGDTTFSNNYDPTQGATGGVAPNLPGSQIDPMADYWAWLEQQNQARGAGGPDPLPDGSGWGGE